MKLNEIMYRKLIAQAEEAREQGFTKLADSILEAVGSEDEALTTEYSYSQLTSDIHRDLWKLATRLMIYYNIDNVEAEKLDKSIISWASKITDDLENTLDVDYIISGPFEPPVPGEDK